MTNLTRPVRRVVRSGYIAGRDLLVIELRPEGLMVREKGRRLWYGPLSYGALLLQGARQYVDEQKRAKRRGRRL